MKNIHFWNGNKSVSRQEHELKLLNAVLSVTQDDYGDYQLIDDRTNYPDAKDEGNIFSRGADLLVTVAGNQKFAGKPFIPVNIPLANGILGQRILIIRKAMLDTFKDISEDKIKTLRAGIPATWVDADLFRFNGYTVVEKGHFDEVFQRLTDGEFDYISLGANEVEAIYKQMVSPSDSLIIEPGLTLRYPFPLIFYVHPDRPDLAARVEQGLNRTIRDGQFNALFHQFYAESLASLDLSSRRQFSMKNPNLPGN
jgi:hypothetical protein